MAVVDRSLARHFDWGLFIAFLLIPLAGMIVLYSSGYNPDARPGLSPWLSKVIPSPPLARQMVFMAGGFVAMGIALLLPGQWIYRMAWPFFIASIFALLLVLQFGSVINGARSWFDFVFFNFQPSEAAKFGLIIVLAKFIALKPPRAGGYTLKDLLVPMAIIAVPMGLVLKQPDFGTAMVLGAIGGSMLLFAGISKRCLIGFVVLFLASLYPAWISLRGYQQQRILALFDPAADARGSGYHIIQSIIAVGSGGSFGKGFMQGTQAHLKFLPEHSTDFIFSVLAEEWGFLGCLTVIALYAFLMFRLLRVVSRSKDLFGGMLVLGVAAMVMFHVLVNVGMVIGLLPVVGIPLILFSYGGSSLVSTMFSIGVAMGVSMRRLSYAPR